MVPIVVSWILRVHGSSEHEPNSKNLQNKQGTGNGVPTGSPMLKLVKEVESVLPINSQTYIFTYPFLNVASLIYEEGYWSIFHGEWVFGFRNGREANAFLALQPFFLLGNQDVRIFRLKDWLIFLGAVSYVVCERICSSIIKELVWKSLASHLFKDGNRLEEGTDARGSEFRPGSMVM